MSPLRPEQLLLFVHYRDPHDWSLYRVLGYWYARWTLQRLSDSLPPASAPSLLLSCPTSQLNQYRRAHLAYTLERTAFRLFIRV